MTFPKQPASSSSHTAGAGSRLSRVFAPALFLAIKIMSKSKIKTASPCLILILILILISPSAPAANVRLYFPARTNTSVLLTNQVKVLPTDGNTRADGGIQPVGLPFNINFPASGVTTQFFGLGFYALTNNLLGQGGIVIRVYDNGSQLYDYTNLLWSGWNNFAVLYGTNLPPSFDQVTNAVGGWYATSNSLYVASNSLNSQITTATNVGITAATATNIAAYQARLATNVFSLNRFSTNADGVNLNGNVLTNLNASNLASGTVPEARSAHTLTNLNLWGALSFKDDGASVPIVDAGILLMTNLSGARIEFETGDMIGWRYIGDGSLLTNLPAASVTNIGTMAYSNAPAFTAWVTNAAAYQALIATNSLSGVLVTRLIATNTALKTYTDDATNALSGVLVTRITAATNDLSGVLVTRLIATNAALEGKLQRGSATLTNLSATGAITNVVAGSNATVQIANYTATVNATVWPGQVTNIAAYQALIATNTYAATVTNIVNAIGGTASQTPWLADINANGKSLTNVAHLTMNPLWIDRTDANLTGGAGTLFSVFGGKNNSIAGTIHTPYNLMLGGVGNSYDDQWTTESYGNTLLGGIGNRISNPHLRGYSNSIVVGGFSNQIQSAAAAVVMGTRAVASNDSVFIFSDNQAGNFTSVRSNQFLVRASNGVGINTNDPGSEALRVAGSGEFSGDLASVTSFTLGSNTVASFSTNVLGATGAGSDAANGTYRLVNSTHYTNDFTHCVVTNNATGNWQIRSNTTVLYSASSPAGTYTVQSGASAAPTVLFGYVLNVNGADLQGAPSFTNYPSREGVTNIVNALATGTSAKLDKIYGVATNLTVASNSIVLIKGSAPYSQIPYTNAVNILGVIVSNAVAGDIVKLGAIRLLQTNAITIPVGVSIVGEGPNTIITNGLYRANSDSGGAEGPCLILRDNVTLKDFKMIGLGTVYSQQNAPMFGAISFDGNPSFTNVLVQNVVTTNSTTAWYVRHTNSCRASVINCQFNTFKTSGFTASGNHEIDYVNCLFRSVGPDNISGDSGEYQSIGFQLLSGTNNFYDCQFFCRGAKTNAAAASVTNTMALNIYVTSNCVPYVNLFACALSATDTNGNAVIYDIANGTAGDPGIINSYGSGFNRSRVFGQLNYGEVPILANSSIQIFNTNIVDVVGTPGASLDGRYYINTSTTYTNGTTGTIRRSTTGGAHWEFEDEFSAVIITNATSTVTNVPYYATDDGGAETTTLKFPFAVSNQFIIPPADLTIQGIQTNTSLAGSGARLVQADANGKLIAVWATNAISGGGGWTGNNNQFESSGGQTNIKSGATLTNTVFWGGSANQYGLTTYGGLISSNVASGIAMTFTNGNLNITNAVGGGYSNHLDLTGWISRDAANNTIHATNGAITTSGGITNAGNHQTASANVTGLTASRLVLTDSGKSLSSAAASGAVPVDADGSATTFAQVNALAPGNIVTNGYSPALNLTGAVVIATSAAGQYVAISNGVIGTVAAITNAGPLKVSGAFDAQGQIVTASGSAGAPAVGIGAADYGFYKTGSSMGASIAGSLRYYVDSADFHMFNMKVSFGDDSYLGKYTTGIIGLQCAMSTNGYRWQTNALVANPVAGKMYSTNGASAITFGSFASVPTTEFVKSYITVSNTTAATPFQVIFPNGTRATNGVPATFDVQGSTEAIFEVYHNAQRSTNVVRVF